MRFGALLFSLCLMNNSGVTIVAPISVKMIGKKRRDDSVKAWFSTPNIVDGLLAAGVFHIVMLWAISFPV